MSTDFQMNYHHNKDNLHVKMQGIFDGNSAHELLNLFLREYRCGGRWFSRYGGGKRSVAVRQQGVAGPVVPDARSGVAAVLQGRKRIQHAPSGAVVLTVPPRKKKSGCCGKCAHCTCRANTGMGTGTEDAHVRGEHNHDHYIFSSGAFS